MKVLVNCEESQIVCKAFREKGHEAYSCDLLPCSGGHPEWHIKEDAILMRTAIKFYTQDRQAHYVNEWDLKISHPPCDDIALCGAKWFDKKRLSGQQKESIIFFLDVWEFSNCTENPKNIMSGWKYLKKWYPDIIERMIDIKFPIKYQQKIQPYQFGHGETKETWLWLNDLPLLQPTNMVQGRENRIWKMPPSKDRAKLRSKTYLGIAKAMAEQWSDASVL